MSIFGQLSAQKRTAKQKINEIYGAQNETYIED